MRSGGVVLSEFASRETDDRRADLTPSATTTTGAGSVGRRTGKFHLRREAIVKSAVGVLNHKGVKGMTLADVAATLNVVPSGIIYYFANKEDLAAACFIKAIGVYDRLIGEAVGFSTPADRLAAFVHGYFRFRREVAFGAADDIAVFNDVRALGDPKVNDLYVKMFLSARDLLARSPMERAHRAAANARTHHLLSQLFWAVAWLPRYDPEDYPRCGDRVLDIFQNGIAGTRSIWAPTPLSFPTKPAPDEAHRETFLRAATDLINEQGYRGASVEKDFSQAQRDQGFVLPSHSSQGRSGRGVLRAHGGRHARGAARRRRQRRIGVGPAVLGLGSSNRVSAERRRAAAADVGPDLRARDDPGPAVHEIRSRLGLFRRGDQRWDRRRLGAAGRCEHLRPDDHRRPQRLGRTQLLVQGTCAGGNSPACSSSRCSKV